MEKKGFSISFHFEKWSFFLDFQKGFSGKEEKEFLEKRNKKVSRKAFGFEKGKVGIFGILF